MKAEIGKWYVTHNGSLYRPTSFNEIRDTISGIFITSLGLELNVNVERPHFEEYYFEVDAYLGREIKYKTIRNVFKVNT